MGNFADKLKEFGIRVTIFFLVVLSVAAFLICIFGGLSTAEKSKPAAIKQTVGQKNAKIKEQSVAQENADDFYPGIARAPSLWVENIRYLYDYEDGFKSGDKEFLMQMVREGKAQIIENPAGVVCSGEYAQGKIIKIRFFEGRYKGKKGYIFANFVQKVKEPK